MNYLINKCINCHFLHNIDQKERTSDDSDVSMMFWGSPIEDQERNKRRGQIYVKHLGQADSGKSLILSIDRYH